MHAILQTGGKQYRVKEGDKFLVEKLSGDAGATVTLGQVIGLEKGDKLVAGKSLGNTAVYAQILEQTRGEKVIIFKKKRRHNYRRKNGHRQDLTLVQVFDISETGAPNKLAPEFKAKAAKTAAPKKAAAPKAAKAAAPKQAKAKKAPAKKK